MLKTNEEIRRKIGANGLKQWQIAEAMGMKDGNFSRKLRTELSEEEKQKILSIIEKVANQNTKNTVLRKKLNSILFDYINKPLYLVGIDPRYRGKEPPYWEEAFVAGFAFDGRWRVITTEWEEFELSIDDFNGVTLSKDEAMEAYENWMEEYKLLQGETR